MIFIIALSSTLFAAEEDDSTYVHGRAVIKVTSPFSQITIDGEGIVETEKGWFNQLADEYEIYTLEKVFASDTPPLSDYYTVEFPEDFAVLDVCDDFSAEGEVHAAFPDYKVELFSTPDDEYYHYQWTLPRVHAEEAWNVSITNTDTVVIGIVDTGVDVAHPDSSTVFNPHPDLADNLYMVNDTLVGYNYFYPTDLPYDDVGHGTHVAGIAAAVTDNDLGVASLAGWNNYNVKIMPVKVSGWYFTNSWSAFLAGVEWAANHGADIINMSWGGTVYDTGQIEEIELAINYAVDSCNCLCVAAAGDVGSTYDTYPAKLENVIAVTSTGIEDKLSHYANAQDWIDICSPTGHLYQPYHDEENILSTIPQHHAYQYYDGHPYDFGMWAESDEYDFAQGTSFSVPMISGLAGMIKAKYPYATNEEIRGRILGTAEDICSVNPDYINEMGAGIPNAYKALTEVGHPVLIIYDISTDDGDNNIFEYGETTDLILELKNWWVGASNLHGILRTDDPYITINDSIGVWGNIGQEKIVANNNNRFILSDNTVSPRIVMFTLCLEADNMNPCEIEFEITVYPNTNAPLISLPLTVGETIMTEAIVSDIDNDGLDEIIVGSSEGYVYVYNNSNVLSLDTNYPIDCTPACGDLDNDGYDEIVAANDSGYVFVWDHKGNVIDQYHVDGECKHTVVLEDVTGDGQLEIIVSTWSFTYYVGVNGFHIINPLTDDIFTYEQNGRITEPISVADINNDSVKEILSVSKYLQGVLLQIFSIDVDYSCAEIFNISHGCLDYSSNSLSGPVVGDINEDGMPEILFSYCALLNPSGYRPYVYCYNYNNTEPLWVCCFSSLPEWSPTHSQLLIADLFNEDEGLEVLFPCDVRIYGDYYSFAVLDENGTFLLGGEQGDANIVRASVGIIDLNSDGHQEIIKTAIAGGFSVELEYYFSVYNDQLNELRGWHVNAGFENLFKSCALAKVTDEYDNYIILCTLQGVIYSFPIDYSDYSLSEWSQYQNNARNTGCYFQPLPEEIGTEITVKHNMVIDKKITFPIEDVESRLIINPGNEILFKSGGLIEGREVQALGTANNPIILSGLCADTTKGYWDGISIYGCDDAQFEYCTITNAEIGLLMENTENNVIEDCTIMYNDIGISLYTSTPYIKSNNISYNEYGISAFHGSIPILSDLDTLGTPYQNAVVENEINIYLNDSEVYLDNGYNDIYSSFDNYIVLEDYPERYLNARYNYWNSTVVEEILSHLVPPETFVIEPICTDPNWKSSNPYLTLENQKLGEGYSYFLDGDYHNAATSFTELIETYPETNESHLGVVGLYSCYIGFKNQWNVLESYLDTLLINPENSEITEKLYETYRNLCLRKKEEFSNAILNYESILDNNPSYEDSCYAVIDIGNTYLEAQYAGKSAMGKYTDLIPKSYESHQEVTKNLLQSIIKGLEPSSNNQDVLDNPILFQSYPNPCFSTTSIDYFIPQSSQVTLKIYNIKGQFVKKIDDGKREAGNYSIMWDGTDYNNKKLGNGVYFYKLDAGKHSTIKKLIMMR